MKKSIIALLFVLVGMLMPVSQVAAADDYTVTSVTYNKDSNTADVYVTKSSSATGGDVVVALYTEDNAFVSCVSQPLYFYNNENTASRLLYFDGDDSKVAKVKAMVWDSISTFKPLSAPKLGKIIGMRYKHDSDFAVVAADANTMSRAFVGGEDVYTLRVIKDGGSKAEVLNISPEAVVHYGAFGSFIDYGAFYSYPTVKELLKKGSAFFYTTDQYGLVDRIDIIFNGQTSFDAYRDTPLTTLVQTPSFNWPDTIDSADWYVTVDGTGILPNNNLIQLFVAPVLYAGDDYVAFSAMASDAYGSYVDTNVEYLYDIASDANIYYYDMSSTAYKNHMDFSKGSFTGIDLGKVSSSGKAYVTDVSGETNFDGALQMAFVMVVDGKVTNALVIGETPAEEDAEYIRDLSYVDLTEYSLEIKKAGSLTADEYALAIGATELYVNDKYFMTLESYNISDAQIILENAFGEIKVCENTSVPYKEYNKIMVDIYGLAKVNQVTVNEGSTVVRLASTMLPNVSGFGSMGTSFTIYNDEPRATVARNGEESNVSSLAEGDIVAIKYDVTWTVNASEKIEILAATDTAEGQYIYYDYIQDLYEFGGEMYSAATPLNTISRGSYYKLYLDPFGRIFAAEEIPQTQNYAILEKYTDVSVSGDSSEYDYIDIVTFEGESKRLYVDSRAYASANVANIIPYLSGGTTSNGVTNFTGSALDGRVIEYHVRPSTGTVLNIWPISTVTFTDAEYIAAANKLSKPLAADAVVLDASGYAASNFKASSLAELSEENTYDGVLVYQNSNGWYEYVIITKVTTPEPPTPSTPSVTNAKYTPDSDFAVAAANSNINFSAVIDDEVVYTLRVMKDGFVEAELLNISKDVVISYKDGGSYTTSAYATNLITKGSAFFYTTDTNGFVDRIDIVLNGQPTFDAYRDTALSAFVQTPDNITSGIIDASDWYVNVNDSGLTANNKVIQLFVAPVILSGDDYVVFSTMASDSKGAYVDTNVEYAYKIADDANIYYYDISPYAPTNHTAFSGGTFYGIELANTSYEGKAYIDDVAGEENFDGLLQVAFVMAVDGEVTNALIIGE